jgi:acylphosphatase
MVKEKARVHLYVSGKVQEVFFRKFCQKKAVQLNVFGWVRNLNNGQVEAVLEGDKQKINKMISLIKKGPALAKPEKVSLIWQEHQNEFNLFEIKQNA